MKSLLVLLAVVAPLVVQNAFAAVPEARIPTTPTGLEEVNKPFGSQYLWVDGQRLVVPGVRLGDGTHASIYLIDLSDASDGAPRKLMDQANIFCTVPGQRLFNVLVGKTDTDRLDRVVMHERKQPQMHRWDAERRQLVPTQAINPHSPALCITPEQFDTLANGRPYPSIPLPEWSARLRFSYDGHMNPEAVYFERGTGNAPIRLDLPPMSPEQPTTPYLAFADEYLLSSGTLVKQHAPGGSRSEETATELPLITLTRDGTLKRSTFEKHFKRLQTPPPGYVAEAYARGVVLVASGWRNEGAGIYTLTQGKLSRVWCNNPDGSAESPKCDISEFKLSPDGCAAAFFSSTTFDTRGQPTETHHRELVVLPLCGQTPSRPRAKP